MPHRKRRPALTLLAVVDASPRVGRGHLMRVRAIVEALSPLRLPRSPRGAVFAGDLGTGEVELARRWGYGARVRRRGQGRLPFLADLVRDYRPRVVLFDAYRRMEQELRLARKSGALVVLLEEGPDRGAAPVDLRIDPSFDAGRTRRRSWRPAGLRLNGLRFVCVRPEIVRLARRRWQRSRSKSDQSPAVVVSLGGGRTPGLSRLVGELRRAAARGRRGWGAWTVFTSTTKSIPEARVLSDPTAVAQAMATATAAVSAAGTTAWELACLGVPSALWVRARNQEPIARAFAGRAAIVCRRRRDLPRALVRLLEDEALRRRLSRAGRSLIDGRGAERVARAILRLSGASHRQADRRRSPSVDKSPRSG